MTEPLEEVSIVALDTHGHGLTANCAIVPGALPGERVLIKSEGKHAVIIETLDVSSERAKPICPWFGTCGGCVAQHMAPSLYQAWKRDLVVEALEREGVAVEVGGLVDGHGAGRAAPARPPPPSPPGPSPGGPASRPPPPTPPPPPKFPFFSTPAWP